MATRRNYRSSNNTYYKIMGCTEYSSTFVPSNTKEDELALERNKVREPCVTMETLPKSIRWKIEADPSSGGKELSEIYGRTVIICYPQIQESKLPKMAIENCHRPGGAYETINITRASPENIAIHPDSGPTESRIYLTVDPPKDHYVYTSERRKTRRRDYCRPCMFNSTSTAATIGSGKKSSKKTKGRNKWKVEEN